MKKPALPSPGISLSRCRAPLFFQSALDSSQFRLALPPRGSPLLVDFFRPFPNGAPMLRRSSSGVYRAPSLLLLFIPLVWAPPAYRPRDAPLLLDWSLVSFLPWIARSPSSYPRRLSAIRGGVRQTSAAFPFAEFFRDKRADFSCNFLVDRRFIGEAESPSGGLFFPEIIGLGPHVYSPGFSPRDFFAR